MKQIMAVLVLSGAMFGQSKPLVAMPGHGHRKISAAVAVGAGAVALGFVVHAHSSKMVVKGAPAGYIGVAR
jgi:hypothetical protein